MGLFYRTIRLVEHGIKPVYVFDGKPPEMKSDEVRKFLFELYLVHSTSLLVWIYARLQAPLNLYINISVIIENKELANCHN